MSQVKTRCDDCGDEHTINASEFEVDATDEQLPSPGVVMTKGITITWDCKCGQHIEVGRSTRFDHAGRRDEGNVTATGATIIEPATD